MLTIDWKSLNAEEFSLEISQWNDQDMALATVVVALSRAVNRMFEPKH